MKPKTQTAIVQSSAAAAATPGALPLTVSDSEPVPTRQHAHEALVRVLAVALNPTDHKMTTHFPMDGHYAGCDFCGIIEEAATTNSTNGDANEGKEASFQPDMPVGTRVCGAVFPYRPEARHSGAFASWLVTDARCLLRVPDSWDDVSGAAIGGVGWSSVALAMSDPDALALPGRPSSPAVGEKGAAPVLVYGGATATGTMACQLLKISGYAPIAVTSPASAALAMDYGAAGTASYTSPNCVEEIRAAAGTAGPIRHALDCITDATSATTCFGAIGRAGGRYACLEECRPEWRTRRAVRVNEVMGYETLGLDVAIPGSSFYTRPSRPEAFAIGRRWAVDMQRLLDDGTLRPHPTRELPGQWRGILQGLTMLKRGEIRGQKLVVRIQVKE